VYNATQQLPLAARQTAESALQKLPSQVVHSVRDGLEQPVENYQQALDEAGSKIKASAYALAQQIERMEHQHRIVIWKVLGAAVISFGTAAYRGHMAINALYQCDLREPDKCGIAQSLQRRRCRSLWQRLCAKVDLRGQRYGEKGEYLPVGPR
jgi:hypothetical protein